MYFQKTTSSFRATLVAAVALAAMVNASAEAKTWQYDYQGPNYSTTTGSCLTTAMHISVRLTLLSKLPPDSQTEVTDIIHMTAKDGINAITERRPGAGFTFKFQTDGSGIITAWSFDIIQENRHHSHSAEISSQLGGSTGDAAYDYRCKTGVSTGAASIGTWTQP